MMTKDKILREALQLVVRTGVRRFQLTELAQRLGVVKSAIYHHFPRGKNQVLQALFEREEERVLKAMEEAAQAPGSCQERLLRLVQAKLGTVSLLAQLYRAPEGVVNEVTEFCRGRRIGFSQRERELLLRLFREGMERGEVRELNLDLLVAGVQAALLELSERVIREAEINVEELTRLMVDVLFSGIGGAAWRKC
ncbi:MAG: TetR/AcrR family transcriptional regulator [Thermoanaerobaculaceae bacterium]